MSAVVHKTLSEIFLVSFDSDCTKAKGRYCLFSITLKYQQQFNLPAQGVCQMQVSLSAKFQIKAEILTSDSYQPELIKETPMHAINGKT